MKDIEFNLTIDEVKQLETENEQNFKTDIELIRERKRLLKEQQDKEEQRERDLIKQESELILNIQNDIKNKFDNNELNLTDEQKREIQHKKQDKRIIIETDNEYINFKEEWEKFIKWKSERQKEKGKEYSSNTLKNQKVAYKYLLEFIDNNEDYNLCNFTSRFFTELQDEFKKIPSNFGKLKECQNKTIKEIISLELDDKKFPIIGNNYINSLFRIYEGFFEYLNFRHIWKNEIFKDFIHLVKQSPSREWKPFTKDEIKLLFNNDIEKGNKEIITDILKIGLYSGMRIGELSQITKDDINEIDGIYCFNIREDLENGKRLKNKNSVRIVPIHSKILEMVLDRVKNSENGFLIWSGSKDRNSDRIMEYIRIFIKDKDKVFHSVRKNFSLELHKFPEHSLIIQYLMGHGEDLQSQTIYYAGKEIGTIEKRKEVIELLKYNI